MKDSTYELALSVKDRLKSLRFWGFLFSVCLGAFSQSLLSLGWWVWLLAATLSLWIAAVKIGLFEKRVAKLLKLDPVRFSRLSICIGVDILNSKKLPKGLRAAAEQDLANGTSLDGDQVEVTDEKT